MNNLKIIIEYLSGEEVLSKTVIKGNFHYRRGWNRFRQSLRDIGFIYTLQLALTKVFPRWFLCWDSFYFTEVDIRNWLGADYSEEGIRWVKPEDDAQLAANGFPTLLGECLELGSRMSVFEADDEIAGYWRYDVKSSDYQGWLLIDLAEDVLWTGNVWVAPSQRGKDLHGRMRSFNVSRLSSEGYQRTLSIISALNVSSLRASLKNTNIAGACTYFRLFNFTLLWVDGRLRVGFWRPSHRLVIQSDELHSVPGQKFGRYKAKELERHINRGNI